MTSVFVLKMWEAILFCKVLKEFISLSSFGNEFQTCGPLNAT